MRPNAGTGTQVGLKNQCPKGYEGSNPSSGIFNPFKLKILKVYGPYLRVYAGGPERFQVVIHFTNGTKTSMSHARWLMTQHLRRRLEKTEHVDHINEDPQDDRLDNFQLLTPTANARKSLLGKASPFRGIERGWRHGSTYGWSKKRCVCALCLAVKRKWYLLRNKVRRAGGAARGPYQKAEHGRMYRSGCRCDLCRTGHRDAARVARAPKT